MLRRIELFSGLSEAEVARAAAALQERSYAAGSAILRQGEAGTALHIVQAGAVKVFMGGGAEGDEEVVIKPAGGAGEYFGERALTTGEACSQSVVALTEVVCLELRREAFDALRGSVGDEGARAMRAAQLKRSRSSASASLLSLRRRDSSFGESESPANAARWDAAVKRCFRLSGMLASMGRTSEAGVAKRLRMAGALNAQVARSPPASAASPHLSADDKGCLLLFFSRPPCPPLPLQSYLISLDLPQGRLLFFYGVGVCVASNYDDHDEFHFESCLLSQYLEDFSSYTLKMFIADYQAAVSPRMPAEDRARLSKLQALTPPRPRPSSPNPALTSPSPRPHLTAISP